MIMMVGVRQVRSWLLRGDRFPTCYPTSTRYNIRLALLCLIIIWSTLLSGLVLHSKLVINQRGSSVESSSDQSILEQLTFKSNRTGTGQCVKSILLYGDLEGMRSWPELSKWVELMETSLRLEREVNLGCRTDNINCTIKLSLGTDLKRFRGKDAVIFGILPRALRGQIETLKNLEPEQNQTWFFYSTESPHRMTFWNQNLNITQLKYHKLISYHWDSHVQLSFGSYSYQPPANTSMSLPPQWSTKKHLIAWMNSNCNEVSWPRKPFLSRVRARLPVDEFGACGTKQCEPRHSSKCSKLIQSYKFLLILGNAECDGLIPADFWSLALANDVVPVIYGVPKADVAKVAPPSSFIHVSYFKTVKSLADYLLTIADDEKEYNKFFAWKRRSEIKLMYPVAPKLVCRTIPHMFDGTPQYLTTVGESSWFNGCRTRPNKNSLKPFSPDQQYKEYNHWTIWQSM
ncbi:alpha-(1,3)-fucosyltransferase 7 [Strongylocentrotus purpuratus]|uniref:Fucosyltransferase n=1 Tax=Strongylocentrotus purpuratus TaxID=7668 RepID=A0A7M7GJ27_STRPU|nr:alpha-(1,3)-fucosyltransferase 7 [Strongylocentrotus purpuratus]|eukprot:XP_003730965.1 PREDICTED: alpha-(1,3)-fucosyltransferase 7-like [Strongylocentrotus purpuratus]